MSDRSNAGLLVAIAALLGSAEPSFCDATRARRVKKAPVTTDHDRKKREKTLAQRRYEKKQQRRARR